MGSFDLLRNHLTQVMSSTGGIHSIHIPLGHSITDGTLQIQHIVGDTISLAGLESYTESGRVITERPYFLN